METLKHTFTTVRSVYYKFSRKKVAQLKHSPPVNAYAPPRDPTQHSLGLSTVSINPPVQQPDSTASKQKYCASVCGDAASIHSENQSNIQ